MKRVGLLVGLGMMVATWGCAAPREHLYSATEKDFNRELPKPVRFYFTNVVTRVRELTDDSRPRRT
jgi:hypothetical protein